jgi:hypothetical protein
MLDSNQDQINKLFDRLDSWRHFPAYALERRADIFFSLYLSEVIGEKLGVQMNPELVPEFPIHLKTFGDVRGSNHSFKVDYLVVSSDLSKAALVELKTDDLSVKDEQCDKMLKVKAKGIVTFLDCLPEIYRASKGSGPRKYLHLFNQLDQIGIAPDSVRSLLRSKVNGGRNMGHDTLRQGIRMECLVVYVVPNKTSAMQSYDAVVIDFEFFAQVVEKHPDPLSLRFAKSLREWAKIDAGSPNIR